MITFEKFKNNFATFEDKPLARGGQKIVYKACDRTKRNVVVKLLLKVDKRSIREIEIVQNNSFTHVPKIYETTKIDYEGTETLAIIEEYIEGKNLRDIINSGKRFNLYEASDFLEKSLKFLIEIWQKKIVHRDIKPENIIMCSDNPFFLDFGIARVLDEESLTRTGGFGPNTPGYAAPEQFSGQKSKIDCRADLFSIGVVTYELLTGINPFRQDAQSVYQIYNNTKTITPVSFQIMGDSQSQFMGLISSLMNKSITARPKTPAQAYDWLKTARKTFEEK